MERIDKKTEEKILDLGDLVAEFAAKKGQEMGLYPKEMACAIILTAAEMAAHASASASYVDDGKTLVSNKDRSASISLFTARFDRAMNFHNGNPESATVN